MQDMERLHRLIRTIKPERNRPLQVSDGVLLERGVPSMVAATEKSSERGRKEMTDEVYAQWESAYLGRHWYTREFLVSLSRKNDSSIRAYATLELNSHGHDKIEIPLSDPTPERVLVENAYKNATFFGEVDPEKYQSFATDEFNKKELLAFLNRSIAGVSPAEYPDWFGETLDVAVLQKYGPFYISTHGGVCEYGYDHNATILLRELGNRRGISIEPETKVESITRAHDFTNMIENVIPHIDVAPLSTTMYLDELQSHLRFLPQDWDVSSF